MAKKEKYIRQRSDGRWEARIKIGIKKDGTADAPSMYFDSRKEARAYVDRVLDARGRGEMHIETGCTLGRWADKCLELYGGTVQDNTFRGYERVIRLNIRGSALARMPLEDIGRLELQAWVNGLRGRDGGKLSPKTVRNALGVVTWLLGRAVEAGVLEKAPETRYLRLPAREHGERRSVTPQQVQELLESDLMRDIMPQTMCIASTGMRESEMLGLLWADIDLESGDYKITGKITLDRETGEPKRDKLLKTDAAHRVGRFPAAVVEELRRHRAAQNRARLAAGQLWQDHGLVFPDALGNPLAPNTYGSAFRRATKKVLGEVYGPHALRHMVATALIRARVDDASIANALGHSSADFTRRQYADVYEDSRVMVADTLGEALHLEKTGIK